MDENEHYEAQIFELKQLLLAAEHENEELRIQATKKRGETCWHTANLAFSEKDRRQFNEFRRRLYAAADQVRDRLFMVSFHDDDRFSEMCSLDSNRLLLLVSEMPILCK
jgi:hypothetical protein